MQVRELQDGCWIDTALLVRGAEARRRREGGDYLKLTLSDRTGTVPAVVLDEVDAARAVCGAGEVVHVIGSFETHPRFGGRIVVEAVRPAGDGEYELQHLLDGPAHPPAQMESDLRELVATVQDPDLRRLLTALFGEGSPTWARFRDAPAAKHYHQAYRHGLLEHCLGVAQAVSAISATFPGINRDVAVTGALLHDIGKLDAYELVGDAIEMSDQGRLYGEIALGYYSVRSMIERLDGFPAETAQAVLHIILSHHGSLEYGSPVVPCTREATLVHMIDNLGGRLGSFDRIEKALPAGEQWSAFDKGIGGGAYFAPPGVDQRRAA
ncbi:MAG TPA: HD domain-containing protein [Solirubrobacteraceae bacterium]|nr:HD domain-containing protein [Solirubrobacteraceae bacterium]